MSFCLTHEVRWVAGPSRTEIPRILILALLRELRSGRAMSRQEFPRRLLIPLIIYNRYASWALFLRENVPNLVRVPQFFARHGRESTFFILNIELLISRLKHHLLRLGWLEFSIHGADGLVPQDLALWDLLPRQVLSVRCLTGLVDWAISLYTIGALV